MIVREQTMRVRLPILITALLAVLAGCRSATTPAAPGPVLALVAASTQGAVQEVADAFTADGGDTVRISAEDSSRLAQQIVQGAPAHLFLSANEKWADLIREKGLAAETKLLLGNSLVLVVPE